MALSATTSVSNWNRATKRVEQQVRSGQYVNAETILLFAGPPRITDVGGLNANLTVSSTNTALQGGDAFYPIGQVESIGVQQAQTVQTMFEIGSRRPYLAAGRVQIGGSLGRVLFKGPSLLRVLYAYYPNTIQMANGETLENGNDSVGRSMLTQGTGLKDVFPPIYSEAGSLSSANLEAADGKSDAFFINLMSELFSHPFGIGCVLRDNKNTNYGAFYLEECMLNGHSFQISASSTLTTENVSFQASNIVPLKFSTSSGARIAPLSSTR